MMFRALMVFRTLTVFRASICVLGFTMFRSRGPMAICFVSSKGLLDGNYRNAVFWVNGKLMGVDGNGNRYYEKIENTQFGRHRWVVYADPDYNASAVLPEWHGWLHCITDHKADKVLHLKPNTYGLEHARNITGEGEEFIYHAKGHALNPYKRDWKPYELWQPAEKSA